MRPPPLLVRVLLPGSGGKVLVAGGAPGANNNHPRTITLGREHICRGFKKRTFVSREVCVIDAGTTATVAALATAKRPVVLERRNLSAPSSSSGLQRITLLPGGLPSALQDKDVLHLFPAEKGEGEKEEEQAAMQRVVVEVEGGGGVEVEQGAEQQQQQQQHQSRRCYSSPPLIMLVLVGLPGSGKTTLAEALVAHSAAAAREFHAAAAADATDDDSCGEEEEEEEEEGNEAAERRRRQKGIKPPRAWLRVCPDARGSSEKSCLEAAARALAAGDCVVVDRTNLTAKPRLPFLAVAREHLAEAHALFLDRGRHECLDRAYERKSHEGGVRGNAAVPAVNGQAKKPLDAPCEGVGAGFEGFVRVRELRDDAANDAAAEEYGRGRVGTTRESGGGGGVAGGGGSGGAKKRSAFDVLLAPPAKKAGTAPSPPPAAASAAASASRKTLNPFLNALRLISENPERAGTAVSHVAGDETGARLLVLRDEFPKGRSHALVLQESSSAPGGGGARAAVIASPRDLMPEDAGLVRDLLAAGRRWAAAEQQQQQQQQRQGGVVDFRFGFHSEPSLEPMHLHAISQDLLGPALKTKKHYNSFKSPFFVDAEEVIAALEGRGRGGPEAEASPPLPLLSPEEAARALAAPLACHRCGAPMKNMPALRAHLEEEEERKRRGAR